MTFLQYNCQQMTSHHSETAQKHLERVTSQKNKLQRKTRLQKMTQFQVIDNKTITKVAGEIIIHHQTVMGTVVKLNILPTNFQRATAYMLQRAICYRPSVCLSVCPSVCPSVRHTGGSAKDGSSQDYATFTAEQPHDSSFLTRNGTLKFQREDRERGRRIRQGYEKYAIFSQ